jgi:hypothetical protein
MKMNLLSGHYSANKKNERDAERKIASIKQKISTTVKSFSYLSPTPATLAGENSRNRQF